MQNAELAAFRESFRAFLERDVLPVAGEMEGSGAVRGRVFAIAGEHGFLGIAVPEEYGGAGLPDPRFGLLAAQELTGAGLTGLALAIALHSFVAAPFLAHHATEEQRTRWVAPLAAGEITAAVAIVPPAEVQFVPVADGARLSGEVDAVIAANGAGSLLVPCRTPTGEEHVVIVVPDMAGVVIEPSPLLGVPGSGSGRLRLDDVFVPEDHILPGAAASQIDDLHADAQLAIAVIGVAGARAALDSTVSYARERHVFGKPLGSFENTRVRLAETFAELTVVESFVGICLTEREAAPLPAKRAAVAKLRATELFGAAADSGLQLHGGYGYMREYPIAQAFADARYLRLFGGTSEAMRHTLADELGV